MNNYCVNSGGNTGIGPCDPKMGIPVGTIYAPLNAELTALEQETLMESLQTKFVDDDPRVRWYPIMKTYEVASQFEDPTTGNLASSGYTEILRPDQILYLLSWASGLCINRIMDQFTSWSGGVYIVTESNTGFRIWGVKRAKGAIGPYPLVSNYAYGGGFDDGQNITVMNMLLNLGKGPTFRARSRSAQFNTEDDILLLEGLRSIELEVFENPSISVHEACGEGILDDDFGTVLGDPTVWMGVNQATGTEEAATSVTNVQPGVYTPVFTAAGSYRVSLAKPSALEAKGMEGWESNSVFITQTTP